MRKYAIAVAAAGMIALLPGAAPANHTLNCRGEVWEIPTVVGPTYYVDNRGADHGNIWLYAERNGRAGLQPDVWAERSVGGDLPEHCATMDPDALIF